ncbi:hypothetical protein [Lacticaseibacillus zhaodongensis]|uniref:hypothetical protein n=1 Tax=Lacticaseibacillus zhaodongensis TaxID=2668065 RepID=UPI0012D2B6AF|nr:hypothetical protein [Lacticaseibacillus zhaodongensis]
METKTYGGPTQILGTLANKVAFSCIVDDQGVDTGSDGKKIIPAGTPVGGDNDFLADDQKPLTTSNDAKAQGVLEHDVDVTSGQGNGTLIVNGYINEYRLPAGVTITPEAKAALADGKAGKVIFFKRNK